MCLRHKRAASEAENTEESAAVREKERKFSKVRKQCVLGSNSEHCCWKVFHHGEAQWDF